MDVERWGRAWHTWGLVAGIALAVTGAVLIGTSQLERTATFGWFAVVPVGAVVVPSPDDPTRAELFGYALAGVGLVILTWRIANGRSPLSSPPPLLAVSPGGRTALAVSWGAAVLLVLAGTSVLLGAPSAMPLDVAPEPTEVSTAYSSELVITLDPVQRPLLLPGALLLLGGSLAAATALGWRTGRPASHPRTSEGPGEDVLR